MFACLEDIHYYVRARTDLLPRLSIAAVALVQRVGDLYTEESVLRKEQYVVASSFWGWGHIMLERGCMQRGKTALSLPNKVLKDTTYAGISTES